MFMFHYRSDIMIHRQGGIVMLDYQDDMQTIQEVEENEPLFEPINQEPQKEPINWLNEIKELLITFVVCFVAVWTLTTFIIKPVQVDGDSMYPTLIDQEVGAVNMLLVNLGGVSRYDVVVVHNESQNENWVKRVIGLPGDTIYAKDDVVYVNGEAIEEPYLDTDYVKNYRQRGSYFTEDFNEVTLGEDEYFLMGDNRIVSMDSRRVGPFKEKDIIGKDVYVIFPLNEMKLVRNPH